MSDNDPSFSNSEIVRVRNGERLTVQDRVASEEPLEIRLGYTDSRLGRVHKSIAITMRTPGDDIALALGFLFTESIISSFGQVASIDDDRENVLRIELSDDTRVDTLRLERHFYTSSSCGVCGKASLETLSLSGFPVLDDNDFSIRAELLGALPDKLAEKQSLFRMTGGNHAVGLFNAKGEILDVKEDVGRHNAMDKLIGELLREDALPLSRHGILVSGRASFELLQKALAAHCPMLLAVGAPSSLAIELAREFNITLLGFLGTGGYNIYHGAGHIL